MDIHELIFVPLILFMIFVAPLWVIMHYRSKGKIQQGLTDVELQQLNSLAARAEKMAERIHTLEAILDAESPQWRNQHD
ncbi:phage shock protein B [Arsukibacterium tuosuense]|uniref:Phage shock protein B n=1 Tax=Arsukibacterium tuosuense TaxID=1323745 RepID=A0A285J8T9_9GAMM|nr:envelope stress response membrane protein PspB [Arsukibacterium tuosuense]SNY55531.1 phage shock protein B [Arsukibacterium tuosuense]